MTLLKRFNAKWQKDANGCWIWHAGKYATGYGTIMVGSKKNGTKGSALAHRVSYELHKGPIKEGMHVLHTCDVRACVNPEHLFIGTNADNIADSMEKNRRKGVKRNRPTGLRYKPWSKDRYKKGCTITQCQINDMRERKKRGETLRSIAKSVGVSCASVHHYTNGKYSSVTRY